ncbi:MAG: hypothetical protein GY950_35300 [bacterium]|nr:hypothetical protein [bacterium]
MRRIVYEDILVEKNLRFIRDVVETDGVFVYPTDTLYGIGGNFFSAAAAAAVDKIKNREDLPYSAAVSGIPMLERLVDTIPPVFYELHEKLPAGKFTFLFNAAATLDKSSGKSDKVGIRIPDVPNILKLIEILDVPFISTSVNRSGEPPLNDPAEMEKLYSFPLLIDRGVLPASKGSTILDITVSPVKCLRRGDDFHRLNQLNLPVTE